MRWHKQLSIRLIPQETDSYRAPRRPVYDTPRAHSPGLGLHADHFIAVHEAKRIVGLFDLFAKVNK